MFMDMDNSGPRNLSFGARFGLAWNILFDAPLTAKVSAFLSAPPPATPKPAAPAKPAVAAPERVHASGLHMLAALQREGRLIDFLRQDVAGFSDEEVGAAARVIHAGCRKALDQSVSIAPVLQDAEETVVTVPAGFDAQRIRLTGNVSGQPPFKGALKHHGWVATEIKMVAPAENLDPRVLAPAEVELS